ncbi:MAG: ATP-dependent Clp protease adaptor ClpS [Proteobacteria bacterium]|nr:ATP-dependent Clp protease adaptor ClpS [Pseudomonadota bacterium]
MKTNNNRFDPLRVEEVDSYVVDDLSEKLEEPRSYHVLFLNDHYTTFDFVELCLQRFFDKSPEEAIGLTMDVHQNGQAVAGIYSREIAEIKVKQTTEFAVENEQPLRIIMRRQ